MENYLPKVINKKPSNTMKKTPTTFESYFGGGDGGTDQSDIISTPGRVVRPPGQDDGYNYPQGPSEQIATINPETYPFFAGSPEEQWRQAAGLSLGSRLYGTNLQNIGRNAAEIERVLRQRIEGTDPQSEIIRAQKAGAMATAGRQMRAAGAGGAAAAAATEAVGRKQDYQIAESLYGQQASALRDYRNLIGNQIAGLTSLMYGEKALAE